MPRGQCTVTDGQATETYGDTAAAQGEIASFYALLTALKTSALVEVAGVVAADRAVGGMAAIDVPLRTQAWLHGLSGKVELKDVSVPPLAPTQSLIVRCINADVVGRERWSVVGDVSGALAEAVTGQPYASAAARFVIPAKAAQRESSGEHAFKYQPTQREKTEGVPSVCLRPFRMGRNARPRTVTFRYQLRPPADCSCADMPTPRLSMACLGLGEDMDIDNVEFMNRIKAVYQWREAFIRANTATQLAGVGPGTPGTPGTPGRPATPGRKKWVFVVVYRGLISRPPGTSQAIGIYQTATVTSVVEYFDESDAQNALNAVLAAGPLPEGTTRAFSI